MHLLERAGDLDFIAAGAAEALRGDGRVIAVTGDAGTGKSSLVRVACSCIGPARVALGACDPLSTPRPLGPIRDILRDLLAGQGQGELPTGLADVCETLFVALGDEPTIMVVEDAQWIDEGSVDALRFVVRRIGALPVLLLLTYRTDEVSAGHPLRTLLGDLARAERAATMALRPFSEAAVREVLAGSRLDPASVLRATGGNPFFVTEIARRPDEQLPSTVRDAVLASTGGLSSEELETLQLIACAPDGIDAQLLVSLQVDLPTLRKLEGTGLVIRTRRGIGFRHELARLALEGSVPPGAGPALHARLLTALEAAGSREWAVLTHHAVAAGARAQTAQFALAAAEEAVRSGAHLEAVAFLSRALEHFSGPDRERAGLMEWLSFEQYMVNQLDAAFASITGAMDLWKSAGNLSGVAAAHERWATFAYYSARRDQAERHARLSAEAAQEANDDVHYGLAMAARAFFAYRRNDLDETRDAVAVARPIAERAGVAILSRQCAILENAISLLTGDTAARDAFEANIDAAISESFDELASMGFTNLAGIDVEQRRFRQAEDLLDRSIPFVVERGITLCQATQTSVRSRMQLLRGRWQAALEDANTVLDAEWAPIARFWPHLAIGVLSIRRGEASDSLHQAWRLALDLDEPLLKLPLLSAFAERAWLTGEDDGRLVEAAAALPALSRTPGLEWSVGELALWLQRIGLSVPEGLPVAEPYRLMLEGRAREAAAWWRRAGAPFDEAMALLWSDDEDDQVAAISTFDAMGATATADRARLELRRRGLMSLPPRPRSATRSNPAGLTNRQLEVARLVAQGFTNAELAHRLYISEKTADHHVSAILGKLGLSSRREVVRRAAEFGLD
jgi:DNA-binding CsgD family transcriptional regulator